MNSAITMEGAVASAGADGFSSARGFWRQVKWMLAWAIAWVAMAYIRLCLRTSRFVVSPEAEEIYAQTVGRGQPTIFVFWHDEFLLVSMLGYAGPLRGTMCVTNDTLGGLMMAAAVRITGSEAVIIGRGESRETRVARISERLRAGKRLAISAAYGQPWFKARPTSLQIAAAQGGSVVALHIEARRPRLMVFGAWHAYLPVPFNRYVLQFSRPLVPAPERVAHPLPALEQKLWGLRSRLEA